MVIHDSAAANGVSSLSNGADGTAATNGVPPASAHVNDSQHMSEIMVPLNDVPSYTPTKKLRIVTIGAGYSGLTLAYKFQHEFPELGDILDHTIYEARHEIGGTWLVNTYPGVLCDVPAHIYVSLGLVTSCTMEDNN